MQVSSQGFKFPNKGTYLVLRSKSWYLALTGACIFMDKIKKYPQFGSIVQPGTCGERCETCERHAFL